MFEQHLEALWMPGRSGPARVVLPSRRNLLRPRNYPLYRALDRTRDLPARGDLLRDNEGLRAQKFAARAATERLEENILTTVPEVITRLDELEEDVLKIEEDLGVEPAAEPCPPTNADAPAAAAPSPATEGRSGVQIVKNDAPFLFGGESLQLDFLRTVFVAEGSPGFGVWYKKLQAYAEAAEPALNRIVNIREGRTSQSFLAAVLRTLRSVTQLYVGRNEYTGFETGVLILGMLQESIDGRRLEGGFEELLLTLDQSLAIFEKALDREKKLSFQFGVSDTDRRVHLFGTPPVGRYAKGLLDAHTVYRLLVREGVLAPSKGGELRGQQTVVDPDDARRLDRTAGRAADLFPGRPLLRINRQETLVRAGIDAACYLLLLKRLVHNTDVYDPSGVRFRLQAFVGGGLSARLRRGAEAGAGNASRDSNFQFLLRRYVLPLYQRDKAGTEISTLFPGLLALVLAGFRSVNRRDAVVAGADYEQLTRFVIGLLTKRDRAAEDVVLNHDAITLEAERGLGQLLSVPLLRSALRENGTLDQFDARADYDLLYFLCLGFIPTLTID
ncbi:minor capsid protein [Hawaiian green turtle herpesvirus]|uniref:Minor capsid protein n=1 Tax=Hawaiian green turtle herpesvirus TaxID=70564 RepID=Q5ZR72_9ALPH|nr:minor capsid protein [Hawaiian green turtle herpesvirus]AAU93323.1 minor capsid protein [Hawaiian green turtle herpesvirus]